MRSKTKLQILSVLTASALSIGSLFLFTHDQKGSSQTNTIFTYKESRVASSPSIMQRIVESALPISKKKILIISESSIQQTSLSS